jgi:asparagine synthase (glutamine-hydrolysing)
MAHSLEVRVPFLDNRLVELMASVSARVQLPGYTRKHVLRRAMGDRLPREVRSAPKRGFNVPVAEWFRDDASVHLLEKGLTGGGLEDLVHPGALRRILDAHRRGAADHGAHLWILLQLATWCDRLGRVTQRA